MKYWPETSEEIVAFKKTESELCQKKNRNLNCTYKGKFLGGNAM